MNNTINYIKSIEELTFADDGMFQAVMHDPEICAGVIERLLNIKIDHLDYPELEKTIAPYYSSKGVRLDVYLQDSDKVIDVEIQNYKMDAPGKRTRYYQSMVDIDSLLKGQDYSELKESYILFICKEDPFMDEQHNYYGLPCYTFKNICSENKAVLLDDKTQKVFYNASAYETVEDDRLRSFLQYIYTNETGKDDFSNHLYSIVEQIKVNDKFRSDYLAMNLHERDITKAAEKKGFLLGTQIGIQQGVEIGAQQNAEETAKKLLKMKVLSHEQISLGTGLSIDQIKKLEKDN